MSNHYHLCITTPQANLVEGMRWLQATFSIRFNRLRKERGHLFQGRYKALLVEPDAAGAVCHYIHLNPIRARIVGMEALAQWPWTSLLPLVKPRARLTRYSPKVALEHAGGLADTPKDRQRYLAYLNWLQEDDVGKKALEFDCISKDWAIGSLAFKKQLLRVHHDLERALSRKEGGPREISQALWAERLAGCLQALKKTAEDIATEPKGAPWKIAIATFMKSTSTASNPWLAQRLVMGSPFRLSRLTSACRAQPGPFQVYLNKMTKCKV
jgi:hypothetical protein